MRIPIREVGRSGINRDLPSYAIPANGWTNVRNARMFDSNAWRCFGYLSVFGAPLAAPRWLLPVSASSGLLWLYAANTAVYATDGTLHTNITRSGGPYTATDDNRWNGGLISTGLAVVNNGKDAPQLWNGATLATLLVDLPNWPSGMLAGSVRPFKRFLVAMDVTKSGTRYGQLVKWSNQAQAGSYPTTWDNTDPTQDAREWPLLDSDGVVIDGGQMGDVFVVYKEDQTHLMEYIGGTFVFKFSLKFKESGILAQQCWTEYEGKHVVATTTDVVIHDGFQMQSLLDDKMRRWWAGRADPATAGRSFVVSNLVENEVWVCVPEAGNSFANVALVLNLKDGTCSLEDLPGVAHIGIGNVDPFAGNTTFDSQTQTFDQMVGQFGQRNFSVGQKRMLMATPTLRRNLLTRSDDIANVAWTKANITLGATVANPRTGGIALPLVTESVDGAAAAHYALQAPTVPTEQLLWTVQADFRAGAATRGWALIARDASGLNEVVGYFNPTTGVLTNASQTGTFVLIGSGVIPLGSSFYQVWLRFLNNSSTPMTIIARGTDLISYQYQGNGSSLGYAGNLQLRQGRATGQYQATGAVAATSALLLQDQELLRDGEGFQSYFERIGLNFWTMDRRGNPLPDMDQKKLLKEIWPQVQVQGVTSINVYAGAQEQLEDPVQWIGPFAFTPGVDDKVDVEIMGRLLAVRFELPELNGNEPAEGFFKLNGYDVVVEPIGGY